ncbi:hypothetical protein ACFO4O_12640 [Glaciecola siphonariae]|uniref:Uncharacterized protein n=1 Tax=Glaciecola siphonariae TaxID=521012 RepID=A0ABV9LZZ1_9ALTE
MSELLKLIGGLHQSFDTVVVAGSTYTSNLKALEKLSAERIIILEPDSRAFAKLEKEASKLDAPLEIKQVALTTSSEEKVSFHQANAVGFSSTELPNKIKKLRPGLTFDKQDVFNIDVKNVKNSFSLDENAANLLILDVNGAEGDLLQQLNPHLFASVIARANTQALYGKSESISKINAIFSENRTPTLLVAETIPPFVNCVIARPAQWHGLKQQSVLSEQEKQIKALTTELNEGREARLIAEKQLREELTQERNNAEEAKHESLAAKETSEKKIKELERSIDLRNDEISEFKKKVTELTSSKLNLEHEHAEHSKSLLIKIDSLSTQINELQSKLTDAEEKNSQLHLEIQQCKNENEKLAVNVEALQSENATLITNIDSETSRSEELQEKLKEERNIQSKLVEEHDKLQNDSKNLTHQIKEKTTDLSKSESLVDSLQKRVDTLSQNLKTSNEKQESALQTLSLNTKLMTKLELDAKDLRKQIKKKDKEQKELKELIRELHEKLKLASAFYQHIEQSYPELITDGT